MSDIIGTNGDDILNGTNGKDSIKGLGGADVLNGKDGDDFLEGNKGSDHSNGGNGNDIIEWDDGDGSDINNGGSGIDTQVVDGSVAKGDEFVVKANGAGFIFDRVNLVPFKLTDSNIEKLDVDGNGGDDKLTIGNVAGTSLKEASFDGGAGNDSLDATASNISIKASGGSGNDTLLGGIKADVLNGDSGNDLLIGDKGNDTHNGGAGNDTIVWDDGDGSDKNDGGSGTDTQVVLGSEDKGDEFVVKAGGQDFLFDRVNLVPFNLNDKNIEKLEVSGLGGDDKLTVKDLSGTDLHKIIFNGGDGKDILDASKTHVDIEAHGGNGKDVMTGGSGDDVLFGDAGDDVLNGGKGDDILKGGAGHDVLTGGAGADTFFKGEGDIITDFQKGIDHVFIV